MFSFTTTVTSCDVRSYLIPLYFPLASNVAPSGSFSVILYLYVPAAVYVILPNVPFFADAFVAVALSPPSTVGIGAFSTAVSSKLKTSLSLQSRPVNSFVTSRVAGISFGVPYVLVTSSASDVVSYLTDVIVRFPVPLSPTTTVTSCDVTSYVIPLYFPSTNVAPSGSCSVIVYLYVPAALYSIVPNVPVLLLIVAVAASPFVSVGIGALPTAASLNLKLSAAVQSRPLSFFVT